MNETDLRQAKMVPVAALHASDWNPRTITDPNFQALCRSLAADPGFMALRPVLAMADGAIYAGHQRFKAAVHLGWTEVPAIVEDVSEAVAKERAIRDNNVLGDWEQRLLSEVMLQTQMAERSLDTVGFSPKYLDQLLARAIPGTPIEDPGAQTEDMPELAKRLGVEYGQLWIVPSRRRQTVQHRFLIGDSLDRDSVDRLLEGGRAGCVITDPPYQMSTAKVRLALRLCADRAIVLCGQSQAFTLVGEDWKFSLDFVWRHRTPRAFQSPWMAVIYHEHVLHLRRGATKMGWRRPENNSGSIIEVEGSEYVAGEWGHAKATGVFDAIMAGLEADWWADPFAGTGPTLLACEARGVKWTGAEIDPGRAAAAIQRWIEAGLDPRLADVGTGGGQEHE